MPSYAIGVDLGGTNLRIAAVDEGGKLLAKTMLGAEVSRGREHVVNELTHAVKDMRSKYNGEAELCGIGVGVPGLLDTETNQVVKSPNLPGWENFDVKGDIEGRLGTSVILENDANVAAIGEQWLGAGRNSDSLCMYTLGTGVGGGLILDGKLWRGWNGMAAELGHCNVEPEGHLCPCGSHGCLEQYASAKAVMRMSREAMTGGAATRLQSLAEEDFNARMVYDLAMAGDMVAKSVFERAGRALGLAIASMINAMNIQLFVIGGGGSRGWDAFAPAMFDEVRRRSYIYALTTGVDGKGVGGRQRTTVITREMLNGDGGLFGAARLPLVAAGKSMGS